MAGADHGAPGLAADGESSAVLERVALDAALPDDHDLAPPARCLFSTRDRSDFAIHPIMPEQTKKKARAGRRASAAPVKRPSTPAPGDLG
jgi:hypothetical protein